LPRRVFRPFESENRDVSANVIGDQHELFISRNGYETRRAAQARLFVQKRQSPVFWSIANALTAPLFLPSNSMVSLTA
jgi:hypothetical protein